VKRLTPAQEEMLQILAGKVRRERAKHPGSGGWVEVWEVYDSWLWSRGIPLGLSGCAAGRTFVRLDAAGLIEDHPGPSMLGLVRTSKKGERWAEDPEVTT